LAKGKMQSGGLMNNTENEQSGIAGFDQRPTTKDQSGVCRMCIAIPGKIVEISSDNTDSALVDVVGVRRKIDLGLLQDDRPVPGDWVLIHVGFAMSKISELDALDQMNTLRALGEIDGAMQEVQGYGLEEINDAEVH
jgi:hydrogenase expression/formation protein HypC